MYRSIESWLDKIVYGDTENAFRRMIRDTFVGEDRIARHRDFLLFQKGSLRWILNDGRFFPILLFDSIRNFEIALKVNATV